MGIFHGICFLMFFYCVLHDTEGVTKMKRSLQIAGIILSICLFSSATFAAEVAKIGVFNFETFLKNSKAGQAARKEMTDEAKKLEKQLETKKQEIEKMRDALAREASVLSEEAKTQKTRDLQIKILDLQNMENNFTRSFNQQQNELMIRIRTEVMTLLQSIGKDEGYLLILENIGVVYAPDRVDLTDRLIKEHDKKYPPKAAAKSGKKR